jgi:hypothetical protein
MSYDEATAWEIKRLEARVKELTAQIDRMITQGLTQDALLMGMEKEIYDLKTEKAGLTANLNAAKQMLADAAPYQEMLRSILKCALADRNKRLLERDEARAAAIQWVIFDGTLTTAPKPQIQILLMPDGKKSVCLVRLSWTGSRYLHPRHGDSWVDLKPGDRWAYLPEPPEVSEE